VEEEGKAGLELKRERKEKKKNVMWGTEKKEERTKEKKKDLKACDGFVSDDAIALSVVDICFHVSSIIFTFRFSSLFFFLCLFQIQSGRYCY